MTDTDRLTELRERAEGMGLRCIVSGPHWNGHYIINLHKHVDTEPSISGWREYATVYDLDTAATLLAALDPEAVKVEISKDCGGCCFDPRTCGLSEWYEKPGNWQGPPEAYYDPGPDCPGKPMPGWHYELMLVPDEVADGG